MFSLAPCVNYSDVGVAYGLTVGHSEGDMASVPVCFSKVGMAYLTAKPSKLCVACVPVGHSECLVALELTGGGKRRRALCVCLPVSEKKVWLLNLLVYFFKVILTCQCNEGGVAFLPVCAGKEVWLFSLSQQ